MKIIPAIDIKDGKVVRLFQGNYAEVSVYDATPVEVARKWQDEGSQCLHLVDLNAAKDGKFANLEHIRKIRQAVSMEIEYGGGVRSVADARELFNIGIDRVILGTAAFDDQILIPLLATYGRKIAVSVDEKDGLVKVAGWIEGSQLHYLEFCRKLEERGVKIIVFTDISRDGTLTGPNFQALEEVLNHTGMQVIASGGVSKLEDVKILSRLKQANLFGVIIGKALYEGKVQLKEALQV